MNSRYLIELDQDREKTAVRRAFVCSFLLNNLIIDLGLSLDTYWAILEFPKPSGRGDIDVLLGPLHSASIGAPSWLMCDHELAALEVKVSYVSKDNAGSPKVASGKGGHGHKNRLRGQLKSLVQLGLNKIALLDIIATPPAAGADGQAWFEASANTFVGLDETMPILSQRPFPYPFVGHWAWGWGSVEGGVEHFRGAGSPKCIRQCMENGLIADPSIQRHRQDLIARVRTLLSEMTPPQNSPYVMVYCAQCEQLHLINSVAGLEHCPHEIL